MKLRTLATLVAALCWVGSASAVQINTSGRCPYNQACEVGDTNTSSLTLNTDGATLSVDVTANAAILTATTTNSATFTGADAASPANTIYDTTGAGSVTVGSADVTAVILSADADVQIQGGATGNVDLTFHDYADSADDDMAHGLVRVNCTTATTGAEDCDFSIGVAEGGSAAEVRLAIDADGGVDLGSANTNDLTVTTDGASLDLDSTTANTLTLTAATTGTAIFQGADAASPANTQLDTTGAGTITIGSADVTSNSVVSDGGTVTLDGYVQGQVLISVIASGALTVNAVNVVTSAADADIPDGSCDGAADVGNWVTVVVRDDSEAVSLTSDDASNVFIVPGLSLDAGDEVDSEGGATSNGDHITVVCSVAESWITTSMHGTWADGGAAD